MTGPASNHVIGEVMVDVIAHTSSPPAPGSDAEASVMDQDGGSAANVAAWLVAVSFSYTLNSFTTFAVESGRRLRLKDYLTFVASGVVGVFANTTTLVLLSYVFPEIVAKLAAIAVSFLVNFSLSHFVVFRRRPESAGEA